MNDISPNISALEKPNNSEKEDQYQKIDNGSNSNLDQNNNKNQSTQAKENKNKLNDRYASLQKETKILLRNLEIETSDTIRYNLPFEDKFLNDENINENLNFFRGKFKAQPSYLKINKILAWNGNYDLLESDHSYIQWLFPIETHGLNIDSMPLQLHELNKIKEEKLDKKIIDAFEMMLDFYGMKLSRRKSLIERAKNYKERYQNLILRKHNFLRITRILKCLGNFGYHSYQSQFISFLINEVFVTKELKQCAESLTKFWIHIIKENKEELIEKIREILLNEEEEN